jgi:formylmethanofuran dehydrogenase subunit A
MKERSETHMKLRVYRYEEQNNGNKYYAYYTIKDGQIVVKDGDIVSTKQSHTIWTNVIGYEEEEKQIIDSIMPFFTQYYSVKWENYQVHDHYVPNPTRVDVEAK